MDIYNKIEELCKIKNKGSILRNGSQPTPRVNYITSLLDELNIDYKIDRFTTIGLSGAHLHGYNIIIHGSGDRMVMAHHDIVNPRSDNANDNSASIICAIALKVMIPELNVAIVDGEEFGGLGSSYLSTQIKEGKIKDVDWVLNLELSGRGGKNFFIGDTGSESKLRDRILQMFPNTPEIPVPFNDSKILRGNGIDSININPTPLNEDGTLDLSPLNLCHSVEDSVDKISKVEMREYVEDVLFTICS